MIHYRKSDDNSQIQKITKRHTKSENGNIIAIIPAYNEERFIASVVLNTQQYVDLVIVVDDGSSDRTANLAEQAGAQVIRQPTNMGKAQALNAGFREARRHDDYAVVVCLDGDAQHDPRDVPAVVAPVLEDVADVVIGSRFLDIKSEIPAWRQVGQHTLTAVTNIASGIHTTDSQSGFRAFSRTAVEALKFTSTGLSVESEMQFLFKPSGLRVVEAPVNVQYLDGNKRNPVIHGLQVLDAMLSLVARRRPLLFFTFPGVICTLLGLMIGLVVIRDFTITHSAPAGLTILVAFLISGGLTIGLTGVVLHSMHKVAERIEQDMRATMSVYLERVTN